MKRRAVLSLLALVIAAGAFASGLYVGERRMAQAVAEHRAGRLSSIHGRPRVCQKWRCSERKIIALYRD